MMKEVVVVMVVVVIMVVMMVVLANVVMRVQGEDLGLLGSR